MVSVLARRSDAACALPRPSATASARLAKTTVSHSQTTTDQREEARVAEGEHGGQHGADLDDEHDRVADHHPRVELARGVGQRGDQHLRVEQTALHPTGRRHHRPSASGPSASAGKNVRPATMIDDADEHADEQRPMGGQGARRRRDRLLAGQRPGQREDQHDGDEPARQHAPARARCCRSRCSTEMPANADPLLLAADMNAYSTSDSPCGPGLRIDSLGFEQAHRQPGPGEHEHRHGEDVERDELDLARR